MLNTIKEEIKFRIQRTISLLRYKEALPFIITGVLSGLICCFFAIAFAFMEKQSLSLFISYPLLILLVAPISMVIAFILVTRYAAGAYGSGILQIIASLYFKNEKTEDAFI